MLPKIEGKSPFITEIFMKEFKALTISKND